MTVNGSWQPHAACNIRNDQAVELASLLDGVNDHAFFSKFFELIDFFIRDGHARQIRLCRTKTPEILLFIHAAGVIFVFIVIGNG